ncbi:TPA: hypothetical protein PXQ76_003848 [Yersinia enterocolitica]|nr:hypothetical protein [Yersinia enterocolitica]HDL8028177.1 hypothetical protein [Yersinia enterocolitica]HDL8162397.1 hypothetical protein [Yersinia enterocolitica]HDL8166389.1 hypothetical protein [Yersinia enterocolitica]HDL8170539.1 hypothetical protein [Yersinia enterocolitica]
MATSFSEKITFHCFFKAKFFSSKGKKKVDATIFNSEPPSLMYYPTIKACLLPWCHPVRRGLLLIGK